MRRRRNDTSSTTCTRAAVTSRQSLPQQPWKDRSCRHGVQVKAVFSACTRDIRVTCPVLGRWAGRSMPGKHMAPEQVRREGGSCRLAPDFPKELPSSHLRSTHGSQPAPKPQVRARQSGKDPERGKRERRMLKWATWDSSGALPLWESSSWAGLVLVRLGPCCLSSSVVQVSPRHPGIPVEGGPKVGPEVLDCVGARGRYR
jgi:hypothetical protein